MKKLLCLLLALLLCSALITPVFADVILPPQSENPVPAETLSGQLDAASQANKVPAAASSVSPTVLYLVVGALVLAAALVLFLLLRKRVK